MNTTDPRVGAIAAGFMIAIHREADRIALAEIAIRSDPATAELAALRETLKEAKKTVNDLNQENLNLSRTIKDRKSLADEIAALREENERIKQNHGCARHQRLTQFCAEAEALRAEVERLRHGLAKYGHHTPQCAVYKAGKIPSLRAESCICGLLQALTGSPQSKEAENGHT